MSEGKGDGECCMLLILDAYFAICCTATIGVVLNSDLRARKVDMLKFAGR